MRIGILEPRDFSPHALERLHTLGDVCCYDGTSRGRFLQDKEVLFVRLAHCVDGKFLREAPNLRVLVSPTTGLTHLNLAAIEAQGVILLTLTGRRDFLHSITASSEHCLGMIIGVLRNYRRAMLGPENVRWDRDAVRGHDIRDLNIGLVGFGRIGQWLGRVLTAMDARVRYYDPFVVDAVAPQRVFRCPDLKSLIEESTMVVLAASYVAGSPPVMDCSAIDALKGRYLVNIGRGELIDEAHLMHRIGQGWFAGVALDVLTAEPKAEFELKAIARLAGKQNFMLTPHIGGATYESSFRTEEFMVGELANYLRCETRA